MNRFDLLRSLLGSGTLVRRDAPFRLLEVTGPDAGEFLHRLCTQDVLGLREGEVRPAAFLDAKGRLLVTCLVFRLGTSFWLEVMAEQQERLAALIERYHFTEKLTVTLAEALPVHETITWGNPGGVQGTARLAPHGRPVLALQRRGLSFLRGHGCAVEMRGLEENGRQEPRATQPLLADVAECLRMAAGFVRVGLETEPTTLALEADLDDHCSATKGCYTGQEIVARIHTYGHVNRKLCLLHLAAGSRIDTPVPLHELEDQLAIGRVMHALPIPGGDGRLGTGYLPKDFQALGTRLALADGAAVEVIGYEPLAPDLPA